MEKKSSDKIYLIRKVNNSWIRDIKKNSSTSVTAKDAFNQLSLLTKRKLFIRKGKKSSDKIYLIKKKTIAGLET